MTIDELIKILENYEVFVDDDYGGSYKSVIAYAPDKKVSRAHTPIGTLKIIDTFEEIQKEKQELKEQLKTSEKVRKEAIDKLKTLGKFDGEKCTRSFKLWTADFNELISVLDIDKGE